MLLTTQEYCGNWSNDELARTLAFKRLRLADIDRQRQSVGLDITLIEAEVYKREVGAAREASCGFV